MADITIIMATVGEESLETSLASLQQQTVSDFKIVLFNDGGNCISSRLHSFPHLDIRLIQSETRHGLANALNAAMQFADTKYIARMDSDDVCLPFRLEAQKEFLEQGKFDLVGSSVLKVNEFGAINHRINSRTKKDIDEELKYASPLPHPTFFGKTSTFKTIGYNEKLQYSQDYDFLARACISGFNIGFMQTPTLIYKIDTAKNTRKHYQQMVIANRISKAYQLALNKKQDYQINSVVNNPSYLTSKLLEFRAFALSRTRRITRILLTCVYLMLNIGCHEQLNYNGRIVALKIRSLLGR